MPIYEYHCTACGHRVEILHGINETAPQFCPACGKEGTLRKTFSAPSIVFKGSGWAKKDRRPSTGGASKSTGSDGESSPAPAKSGDGNSGDAASSKTASGSTTPGSASTTSSTSKSGSGDSGKD
jgi:putative FmdB family regulatory protein